MFNFITKYFKKDKTPVLPSVMSQFELLQYYGKSHDTPRPISFHEIETINRNYFNACIDGNLESIKEMFNKPHIPSITYFCAIEEVISFGYSDILEFLILKAKEQNFIFGKKPQDYKGDDNYFDIEHYMNCVAKNNQNKSEKCFPIILRELEESKNYSVVQDLTHNDFITFIGLFQFDIGKDSQNNDKLKITFSDDYDDHLDYFKKHSFLSLFINYFYVPKESQPVTFIEDFNSFLNNYFSKELLFKEEKQQHVLNQYKIYTKSLFRDRLEAKLNIKDTTEKVVKI